MTQSTRRGLVVTTAIRSLRSSSRRRGGSLARLSRSRVRSRLPRHRASLAPLVITTTMIRCILAISRLHLGVCLWLRRSSVASLVIAAAWWIDRAPLASACRLAPPVPSHVSRVAHLYDGDDLLHSRAICGCISACASSAVGLRLPRSSSRRRGGLLARPSRPRVGLRPPRRRASLVSLVVTTAMLCCIFASFGVASKRVPLAPSVFGRFARHRDGVVDCSRASRPRVWGLASCAVARLSRYSSSRRR